MLTGQTARRRTTHTPLEATGMDLTTLSGVLWFEREQLENLLFRLESQRLLAAAGGFEWLLRASEEVEAALTGVSEAELRRAVEFDTVAHQLGLAPGPSLLTIAAAADEPWRQLLTEHQRAFSTLAARIQQVADASRGLVESAQAVTDSVIAGLRGVDADDAPTYTDTRRSRHPRTRSTLLDAEI
jgi:hypothetical protein